MKLDLVSLARLAGLRAVRYKIAGILLKNSPNIRYSTRGRITRPRSIIFTNRNRLDLGHRVLVLASTANVESGPRFAEI